MKEQLCSSSLKYSSLWLPSVLSAARQPETHQSLAWHCPGPGAEPAVRAVWRGFGAQARRVGI